MSLAPLHIGSHQLPNPVLLAPMSGVSDLPFRRLAHSLGAGLVVSEMVASEELVRERADAVRKAEGRDLKPFVIQLAGREAHWMAEGARVAAGLGADIIDINMGCPAREVTGKLSGSALMRDLDHAVSLVEAVVGAVQVPVTLKMRLGWDERTRNAAELARRAEAAGVQLVTVHGRTRCQFFKGQRGLGGGARRQGCRAHPCHRQWRYRHAAGCRDRSRAIGCRRCDDRTRSLWRAVAAGTDRELSRTAVAILVRLHLQPQGRNRARACRGDAVALRHVSRLANARKHVGWYLGAERQRRAIVKAWRKRLCTEEAGTRLLAELAPLLSRAGGHRCDGVAA